ncbi:TonB-dependent receptor [Microbulbifer epialgicus]|uniref:TonB-dependent receptor n=1 Tax=Microbulbifer epialgicus TaxID=393907 RepID=A0ABV4P318_9GAMM
MSTMFKRSAIFSAIAALMSTQVLAEDSSDKNSQIEEITVTGQKIERSLQDTKESVAIFTGTTIEQRNLVTISDIYQQTAGVSGDQFGFRVRGISSGTTGTARSELASIYVDGVGLSGWVKNEGPSQLWDVDQVEVLRGPQSTNLGRNALAGALVVNTADPIYANEAKVRAGAGNYGSYEAKGVANINLVDGVSAIRIAVEESYTDGYVDNITHDEDDYGRDDNKSYRLKWLLEPSDDLRVMFSLQHLNNEYGDSRILMPAAGYSVKDRISTNDTDGRYALDANLASLTLDYQINDSWSFRSITAGQDGERVRTSDYDRSAADVENGGGVILRYAEDTNISQEFRVNYESDTLRGSAGIYYSQTDAYNTNDTQLALDLESILNESLGGGFGTYLVGIGLYPASYDLLTGGYNDVETTNVAIFSEWEMDLSQDWVLSAGLRYDREEQKLDLQNLGSSSTDLPQAITGDPNLDPVIELINASLVALSSSDPLQSAETDFEALLPHIGVTYRFNDDVSTSFFIKEGYRSGGTEITIAGEQNPYDPEYLLNYEFALRALVLDGQGTLNANLYYGDWTDQQVSIPDPDFASSGSAYYIIENAGESEIYGIEVAIDYTVNEALALYATAALSKTEYKEFSLNGVSLAGNEFKYAPEHTASIGANYLIGNGFFVNANVTYQGESYADDSNAIELDSFYLANFTAGYEQGGFKTEVFVNNLFDETYATDEFGYGDWVGGRAGAPRTFGARATMTF